MKRGCNKFFEKVNYKALYHYSIWLYETPSYRADGAVDFQAVVKALPIANLYCTFTRYQFLHCRHLRYYVEKLTTDPQLKDAAPPVSGGLGQHSCGTIPVLLTAVPFSF